MVREIELTQGQVALVDDEDFERVSQHKWCLSRTGSGKRPYAMRKSQDGRTILMHREIVNAGSCEYVDHCNGDGLDNRRCNLRKCTNAQNMANRGPQNNNSSGYKGVSACNSTNRWRARIKGSDKYQHLGYHATAAEAAIAYNKAAARLHGEFAFLNDV